MKPALGRIAMLALAASSVRGDVGSKACATCHAAIYQAYQVTGMARSSGVVTRIEKPGEFRHAASGVRYEVYGKSDGAFFSFDLAGVHGSRPLEYFVGSGLTGHSYLFRVDGFLYQAPVSWYSGPAKWDLSPGYEQYEHLYLTRPVEPSCLGCHASRLQPVAGTRNGYQSPPFLEDGLSCERCHGPGDTHVLGRGKMINPAAISPARRDAICAACHLSGAARVARRDDHAADSPVVFVWSGGDAGMDVTSHVEKLSLSACKKASGDRLWCGTCHDPHRAQAESEKAAFYRAKCLECHQPQQCGRGADCTGCHMPKSAVRDVSHVAYTDHAIRKPGSGIPAAGGERRLVPFGGAAAGAREFGLAYAKISGFEKRAIEYLERAPMDDAEVLAQLAYLYDSGGDERKAIPLYEKALAIDPSQVTAAVNLAIARMRGGKLTEAIRLWRDALDRSPGLENARLSLALAQYRTGDVRAAESSLTKLLELNPADAAGRRLWNEIRSRR